MMDVVVVVDERENATDGEREESGLTNHQFGNSQDHVCGGRTSQVSATNHQPHSNSWNIIHAPFNG